MSFHIHQKIHQKTCTFTRKLATSAGLVDNRLNVFDKGKEFCFQLEPLGIFTKWPKSKTFIVREIRSFHAHYIKTCILNSEVFVAKSLMDMYFKVSAITDAVNLFDEITDPDVTSWNILISGHNQNSMFDKSWRYFCRMHSAGFDPNQYTFGSVLSACSALRCVSYAKMVYSMSIKNGLFSNGYVRAGLIDLFSKYSGLDDALKVFSDSPDDENVVCWNSIISGAVKCGNSQTALEMFSRMLHESHIPNSFTFSSVLTACTAVENIGFGREVHGLIIKHAAKEDVFIGTALVDLYAKCGHMVDAVKEFWRMPFRNVVSWTALVSGFVQTDDSISALHFFREMKRYGEEANAYTLTSIITACAKLSVAEVSTQIHCCIIKAGLSTVPAVRASLVNMYSKLGEICQSEKVFLEIENAEDLGLWASMMTAYSQNQGSEKATFLFQRMLKEGIMPDMFLVSSLLSIIDSLALGKQIHSYMIKTGLVYDVSSGNALSTLYSKCRSLEESYKVFEEVPNKDIISISSMIAGFAEHGCPGKSIQLFREMLADDIRPDQTTLIAVLTAVSSLTTLLTGKEVHAYAFRMGIGTETPIGGALVNMYSKCGELELARRAFTMMTHKNHISCSALISGYAQMGYKREALILFLEMMNSNLEIDPYTISSVLGVASLQEETDIGIQLHGLTMKFGFTTEASVGSSLAMMYSRSGKVESCRKAFDQIIDPDLFGWTTMIMSYAQNGKGKEGLELFELMKMEGINPDSVTFVGVLLACSHAGLVKEGYFYLNSMSKDYGIEPGLRHYACMVDILGRSGRLEEAEKFINSMSIKPNALIWGTLVAACQVHGDIETAKRAANKIMELKPKEAGAYISLANIHADVGRWEDVVHIRSLMKEAGINKDPGLSYV